MLGRSIAWCGLALLASCSPAGVASLAIDQTVVQQVDEMYGELVLAKDDQLLARIPKSLLGLRAAEQLGEMRTFVPEGPARPAVVVAWNQHRKEPDTDLNVVHRYDYADSSVLFLAGFTRRDGDAQWTVVGLRVIPAQEDAMRAATLGRAKAPPPAKAKTL